LPPPRYQTPLRKKHTRPAAKLPSRKRSATSLSALAFSPRISYNLYRN
jgi:hypothetical protein